MNARELRTARRRRRMITYLWIFGLAVLTISLIYWEQTALLYILATLGVTLLLVIVAVADLAHAEVTNQSLTTDNSTPVGSANRLR
jgi:hypothetical protein